MALYQEFSSAAVQTEEKASQNSINARSNCFEMESYLLSVLPGSSVTLLTTTPYWPL